MDIRRFGAHYRSPTYTLKRTREVYETYYDIKYPGHERQAGRPLRVSSAYGWHRDHGAAFGEKSGWERVNWYEANAPAGDETLRPRGWAGPAVVAGHRRRARRLPRARRAVRRVLVRQDRGRRPGRRRATWSGCATTTSRATSGRSPTRRCSTRRGGIECDFTVTRVEEEPFSIVTGTAFGNHDLSWIRRHAPRRRVACAVHDVTARWACFGLWGPRARDVLAPLTPDPLDFGYMTMREHRRRRRAGARAARDLHRRAGLGALLPDRVRRRAVARAVGGGRAARARRRRLPGDRHAAPGEGLPRVGGRHHARRDAPRGGARLLRARTTRRFLGRDALAARAPAQAPALPGARRPALGRAGQRARARRTARSSGA